MESITPSIPIEDSFIKGTSHPPKNSVTVKAAPVIILAYSAMKNIANFILLYSVWYPPTNSCSASVKSKGSRLVSA
jgi:hypothetical protein